MALMWGLSKNLEKASENPFHPVVSTHLPDINIISIFIIIYLFIYLFIYIYIYMWQGPLGSISFRMSRNAACSPGCLSRGYDSWE